MNDKVQELNGSSEIPPNGVKIRPDDIGDRDCKKLVYEVIHQGKEIACLNTLKEANDWCTEHGYIVII